MSYTTPNDFLLINNISTETIYEKILNNDKILLDIDGETVGHKSNIDGYYNNLIKTNLLDITINNPFKNKILYYSNSKTTEYSDTFVINNNKNNLYNIIEIDNSYYASELIKKYMFLYDFLSEYYRNLSIIKKTKYAIDNKSLYEHTFNMKIRYFYKKNFDNTENIININNDNKDFYYYLVSFKLEDQDSKSVNKEILIQPIGDITELDIDSNNAKDDHNTFQTFSSQEKANFSDSFRKLFTNIIKEKHLQVNTELSYYHLLGLSYKFKFHKLLLTYYISKVIYFYFKKKYTTKIKEIDDIITQHYPRIFENYNQIVNNSTPNSLITIMKNSEKKVHVANKNKEKDLQKINNSILKLKYNKEKIRIDIERNNSKYTLEKLKELDKKFKKFEDDIKVLEFKKTKISEENYITKDAGEVQEAIDYKSNLRNYNTNMINIDEKIKKMNKTIKSEKSYLEELNLVNYFIIFLFIIILFSFILDYSTTIVNISIPIFLLTISVVIYLVIKYALNSRFNDNISSADLVSKNKHVIQSFYNAWGGKYLENFYDDSEDVLDPIVADIIDGVHYEIGSYISDETLLTLIDAGIDKDIRHKIYFSIPDSDNRNIDLVNQKMFNTNDLTNISEDTFGLKYSDIWNGWPTQPSPHLPQVSNLELLKTFDLDVDNKIATFVNNMSQDETHTKYILNIPDGIDSFPCQVLVVGGGSFGGHIATEDVFNAANDAGNDRPSVTNMGEGGAGGAVLSRSFQLLPGKYEIGVGRGGIWKTNLETSLVDGQAQSSYIKEFNSGLVRILAVGARFEKYDPNSSLSRSEEEFNQQLSGGRNITDCDLGGNCVGERGGGGVIKNREATFSNGGRGGMIKPLVGQVGWTFQEELGNAKDTYYLSSKRYEGNEDTGSNGQQGVSVSEIFGTFVNDGIFAAGGGAASYCKDSDNDTFHQVDGLFYTCSSSEDTFGQGGNGGGGNGDSHGTGKNGLHNTGSGGGGGKFAGGNGGSGIVLIKYNISDLRTKIQAKLETIKLELSSSIREIATNQTATELYDKKMAIARMLNQIKLDKLEIDSTYGLLDQIESDLEKNEGDVQDYEGLLNESKARQDAYEVSIRAYNASIDAYNGQVTTLEGNVDTSLRELERIKNDITRRETQYKKNLKLKENEELTQQHNETEIALNRATYLQKVGNRLKAEACKRALRVAQVSKRAELLKLHRSYSEANNTAIAEAETERIAAIKDAIAAEKLRDNALNEQYLAEQRYKTERSRLLVLESAPVDESEKNYSVTFRLELDYRIAGLYGVTDNYYEGISETTEDKIREHLDQEKEKREMFVTNIIKELLFATSKLDDGDGNVVGTLPNRFQILRIHSGNLVDEASLVKTQAQIDEETRNKLLFNYENSAYRNEFNVESFSDYSNFEVKEHFIDEAQTEEELLSSKRVKGYIAPDNATVIEMQIIAHPQKKQPYAKNILEELESQSNILDSDLRSTGRYFRFLNAYKRNNDTWTLVQKGRGVISEITILSSNIGIINDIKSNFGIIENLQADYPTYYDNVNPLLKKEHRIYKERNEKANIYNKLSENSLNVNLIEITKKELTLHFILNLCMLLAITMIILKFINNYIIFIIFIVIFIILLTNYIYNIVQTVRTKYKSNYWLKPRERKYINA